MKAVPLPDLREIPIAEIHVANPRNRNAAVHAAIRENIGRIGLKRPVTVRRRSEDGGPFRFDLICGQGRLEACASLGHLTIPAVIVKATEAEGLMMSLVENVARRHRSGLETMREIAALRSRGHTQEEIARTIGSSATWVSMVLSLLDKGEERLVASVECGIMPISLAIDIANGSERDLQSALANAYESGELRGSRLAKVRLVLRSRVSNKLLQNVRGGPMTGVRGIRSWNSDELIRIYEKEASTRRMSLKKAELVQSLLVFAVEAFRVLLADDRFVSVLGAERLDSMPAPLARLLKREKAQT